MNPRIEAARQRAAGTLLLAGALAAPAAVHAEAADGFQVRGNVGVETLILPQFEGEAGGMRFVNPLQERQNLAFKGVLEASLKRDAWSGAIRAFLREDVRDDDRDAHRLDEAWVQYATPQWDVRAGNQLVTWGSVESVSPLDVVNPRDYEEDIVEPAKIGLAMVRARRRFEGSDLSLYWLPQYKPSQYAGPHSYYSISGGGPELYPAKGWDPAQWAARYFKSGDGLDVGVSFLRAIERNPSFAPDFTTGQLVGSTYKSNRLGTDVTWVVGDLVLKLEAVWRNSKQEGNRNALLYALGGEYTFSSLWQHSDLTFFLEWLGTSHNVRAIELMQNDLFAAARWTFNDRLKQRLQLGTFQDLDRSDAYVWRVEYQLSPVENVDVGGRYTITRNYYPGPPHVERNTGVFQFFVRYSF